MKQDNNHKIDKLNSMLEVSYNESKEDIWKAMEVKMKEPVKMKPLQRSSFTKVLSIAASIAILLGAASFFRFYKKSFVTKSGVRQTIELPDGSVAKLNGESELEYHPYWWNIKRDVVLEGEAYFEVAKGKKFSVKSNNGTTWVLGTSFNIYTRDNNYEVVCLTGKVRVQNSTGNASGIITPNQKAILNSEQFDISETNAQQSVGWIQNNFFFTSENIERVFKEIAITYGVEIKVNINQELLYSGNFSKTNQIEEVLNLVCKSLNLKFVKEQSKTYKIISN